jgi:hypothetical protein
MILRFAVAAVIYTDMKSKIPRRKKRMASEKTVVEGDFKEVEVERVVRTEFTVGIDDAGSVYYRIGGHDQSLIILEGLIKYAKIEMDRLWARSYELGKQNQEAGA